MNWQSVIERTDQILDEERSFPTVGYAPAEPAAPTAESAGLRILETVAAGFAQIGDHQELQRLRAKRPRSIVENSRRYVFKSANYNLLRALLSTVPEQSRLDLVRHAMLRVVSPPQCTPTEMALYPAWGGMISELPLVAELLIRNGCKEPFMTVLAEAGPAAAHIPMLRQMEEMVAFEFTLFTYEEYEQLSFSVKLFGQSARRRSQEIMQTKVMRQRPSDLTLPHTPETMSELVSASVGLVEQCRKARFIYVKGELQEGLNLEVNQDKDVVVSDLRRFGFTNPLIESLNEAERLYRGQGTEFDLKSSVSHLRSFMESLHAQAIPELCALKKVAKPPTHQWKAQLDFLRDTDILSKQEHQLVSGLWAVISDQAVHPLVAEREYARLARNMVIEYAFLFLKKLEKLGFQTRAVRAIAPGS